MGIRKNLRMSFSADPNYKNIRNKTGHEVTIVVLSKDNFNSPHLSKFWSLEELYQRPD